MKDPSVAKHLLNLKGFFPDQLLEVVRGAKLEHYILANTRCNARIERWSCKGFSVDVGSYSFPVRDVGVFGPSKVCLGYMRSAPVPVWMNGFDAGVETMEFYPEGCDMNYRASAGSEWQAIEFDAAALQRVALEHLGRPLHLPWKHAFSFRVPRMVRAALDRKVRLLWTHSVCGSRMIDPILRQIAEILSDLQRGNTSIMHLREKRRVELLQRADAYLQKNISEPFDLEALAEGVGVSSRALERHFVRAYGLSPSEWARCLALHYVRRRLSVGSHEKFTIEGVARECGFRHMGRFSLYYRELFDESPIETFHRSF